MNLDELRHEINTTDAEIVRLLCRRMEISVKVGEYKRENALPVYDAARETALLASVAGKSGEFSDYITEIYKSILVQSKKIQEKTE